MPTYVYACKNCGNTYEKVLPIAQRHDPENEHCSVCSTKNQELVPAAPAIADAMRIGRFKAPDSFNDVLRNVKKTVPGASFDIR